MTSPDHEASTDSKRHERPTFHIKIDRTEYAVHQRQMTGLELRHVVSPPIPQDRDLFEVVMGRSDPQD